jgi:hypothetical protein
MNAVDPCERPHLRRMRRIDGTHERRGAESLMAPWMNDVDRAAG